MITGRHPSMCVCIIRSFVAVITILRLKAESLPPPQPLHSLLVCNNGNKTLSQLWYLHKHLLTHWPQRMCPMALVTQWTARCLRFGTVPQLVAKKSHGLQWYFSVRILLAFLLRFRNGCTPRGLHCPKLVPRVTIIGDDRTRNEWKLVKGS